MSSNKKPYFVSVSKTEKIKCRVESCQEEVTSQNYGRHLERFHPHENSKDRRPYGKKKFSFSLGKQSSEKEAEEEVDLNDNIAKEVNEEFTKIFPEKENPSKRARVESQTVAEEVTEEIDKEIRQIEDKVNKVIENMKLKSPKPQKSVLKSISCKLEFILENMKVSETVEELEKVVQNMKELRVEVKEEKTSEPKEDIKVMLRMCRNVEEIQTKVPEFEFKEDQEKVVCTVCDASFKYDVTREQERRISPHLADLKNNLKHHLDTLNHQTALVRTNAKEKTLQKEENRNRICGMNLGRTCYHILEKGRPTKDFTELLSLQHSNGADVGDINHSTHFVNNLGGCLSKVIMNRVQDHLSTRLQGRIFVVVG